jgi:hypothetical protein
VGARLFAIATSGSWRAQGRTHCQAAQALGRLCSGKLPLLCILLASVGTGKHSPCRLPPTLGRYAGLSQARQHVIGVHYVVTGGEAPHSHCGRHGTADPGDVVLLRMPLSNFRSGGTSRRSPTAKIVRAVSVGNQSLLEISRGSVLRILGSQLYSTFGPKALANVGRTEWKLL